VTAPPVLVATRSVHKLEEIRDALSDLPIRFLSPADLGLVELPEEDELEPFDTFALNAMSKAKYFHGRCGLPVLADDSGLCVDALDGGPGVRTKRFAPPEHVERWGRTEANNRWLLEKLAGVDATRRGARYRCAIALADDLHYAGVEDLVEGRIAENQRGSEGFGYDPLFLVEDGDATFAELPPSAKRDLSHRSRALARARPWLEEHVLGGR